ncbi:hypothetical protein BDV93DRAFT_335896 [Ceratobasidium sp. AG-I]|nr:hypothetical protein BDV93DRAFT_335896 [Ceratobasidium sp. AG-I]
MSLFDQHVAEHSKYEPNRVVNRFSQADLRAIRLGYARPPRTPAEIHPHPSVPRCGPNAEQQKVF